MKNITNPQLTIIVLVILVFSACKKDTMQTVPVISNSAPVARAGRDTTIVLPNNTVFLDGTASSDAENNINIYSWEIIKGPGGGSISDITSNSTKSNAGNLRKGIYFFELTVTDYGRLSSKDTVQVTVAEPASYANAEIILKDQPWDFSWIMEIDIYHLLSYLPANSYFKNIFMKRDYSTEWELVVPYNLATNDNKYSYGYDDDILTIVPNQDSVFSIKNDKPDIKIEY